MDKWKTLAPNELLDKTIESLKANGFNVIVTENSLEAKDKVLELIPKNSEVMTMTSVTLETIGLIKEIDEGNKFVSVHTKLRGMNRETQNLEMQKLGAAPEYAIGSVHAISSDGHVLIASNTGSQLAAYVYGSPNVIWIAGTQKIVKDTNEGMQRVYDYCLPPEDKRAEVAYGHGSNVSKLLIVNKENKEGRITIILVKEELGF